jgi:hypothetical protein
MWGPGTGGPQPDPRPQRPGLPLAALGTAAFDTPPLRSVPDSGRSPREGPFYRPNDHFSGGSRCPAFREL